MKRWILKMYVYAYICVYLNNIHVRLRNGREDPDETKTD